MIARVDTDMADDYCRMIRLLSYYADPYFYANQSANHYLEKDFGEQETGSIDELFTFKVTQSAERVRLILGDIYGRRQASNDILESIQKDILLVRNWRLEIPFPRNYYKDRSWLELNKIELQLHAELRAERGMLFRDTAPLLKELRDALMVGFAEQKKAEVFSVSGLEKLTGDESEVFG